MYWHLTTSETNVQQFSMYYFTLYSKQQAVDSDTELVVLYRTCSLSLVYTASTWSVCS